MIWEISGICIGGITSSAIVAMVLAVEEWQWSRQHDEHIRLGFPSGPLSYWIARVRYVDGGGAHYPTRRDVGPPWSSGRVRRQRAGRRFLSWSNPHLSTAPLSSGAPLSDLPPVDDGRVESDAFVAPDGSRPCRRRGR